MDDPKIRKSERVKGEFIVKYRFRYQGDAWPGEGDNWSMMSIADISAKGLAFYYNKNIQIGTALDFQIKLPVGDDHCIDCVGRVIRIEPAMGKPGSKVGIEFVEISEKGRDMIEKFAKEYKK